MHDLDTRTAPWAPAWQCRSEAPSDDRAAVDELKAVMGALAHLQTGIVLVDRGGRIVIASRPAQIALAACGLASRAGDLLRAATPRATAQLGAALADPGREGGAIAIGAFGDAPLMAWVADLPESEEAPGADGPAAALFVSDPTRRDIPSERDLQARFGLTPAEAVCAREMLVGDGLSAYARRVGISLATARTHLRHVFDKTGTRRQAQLVRTLLSQPPFVRDGEAPR